MQNNVIKIKIDYKVVLKGDPISIVGQNINLFHSKDVWRNSFNSGIELTPQKGNLVSENVNLLTQDIKKIKSEQCGINAEQKMNDKKLEFFTYDSHWNLAFDKFDTNKANKIYHGPTPIIIKFKETPKYVNLIKLG
jgi:hypothetical protein